MNTIEANNIIAASKLAKLSTKSLLELWQHSEKMEIDAAVARARGWIMDALELRNAKAFENWMTDETGASPEKFFT